MSLYKEDVYETEDIPCEQSVEVEEQFEQPEVEKIHLDVGGVRKRFGNCILDAESADFSDSVSARRLKRGYKASEIFEAEPTGSEEEETFEQRYERLSREVKKLVAEAEQRQGETPNPNKADILALNDLLKSVAKKCPNPGRTAAQSNSQAEEVNEPNEK